MGANKIPLQYPLKGDNSKMMQGRATALACNAVLTWNICLPNKIKIAQKVYNLWSEQDLHFKISSWEITPKRCKMEQPFLHVTHHFDPIYMPTKCNQNISRGLKVMKWTNYRLQTATRFAIAPVPHQVRNNVVTVL